MKNRLRFATWAAALLGLGFAPGRALAQVPADVTDFVTIPPSTGIVTIKDTSYAIPTTGDVRYFSPSGDNATGDGLTPATAWRTLTNALLSTTAPVKIPTGATLVFAEGTYPTGVPTDFPVPPATTVAQNKVGIRRALTLQPAPGAKAWFTGSLPVTNWVADNGVWRADNWTYRFPNNSAAAIRDPAYPASHLQDMVFVDDLGLKQVLTRAEVQAATATSPATFWVDYANQQIFMGANPTGHRVEAAAYFQALELLGGSSGTKIRGLGFRNYGGDYAVAGYEFGYTIENCTFAWNALIGLRIGNTPSNVRLRGNTFTDNGHQGAYVGGNDVAAPNFVIDGNTFRFNNNEGFKRNQSAAGLKFLYVDDAVVRNNLFEYNNSMGVWFDLAVEGVKVLRNVAHGNAGVGIFFEVSRGALIAGNVAYGNSDGVYVSGSSDAQVYNNTLVGNLNNLRIKDTSRRNDEPNATTRANQLARGITYDTYDVDAWNNVLADGRTFNASILNEWTTARPTTPPQPLTMVRNLDHNFYLRSSTQTPAVPVLVTWNQLGLGDGPNQTFNDLAPFAAATGFEAHGAQLDGRPLTELFVDWTRGNFRLRLPANLLPAAKQDVPAAVRAALGLSATGTVPVGAYPYNATATGTRPGSPAAVALSPNPTQDAVTITWAAGASRPVSAEVLDAAGRRVAGAPLAPTGPLAARLPLAGLPAGLYLLRLVGADGAASTQRLEISR